MIFAIYMILFGYTIAFLGIGALLGFFVGLKASEED